MSRPLGNDPGPLYQAVAGRIEALVEGGAFGPGDRVPSVRKLSRQLSVSVSTVLEAYRLLEDRYLIEARPQSGYYVRRVGKLPELPAPTPSSRRPASMEVDDLAHLVCGLAGDELPRDIVRLGAAIPSPEFLPTARLNRFLARAVRANPSMSQSYDSLSGVRELRNMIARRMLEAGCSVRPSDVVTTAGATAAIQLCLRAVTSPGDTVAVESPTFYGLLEALDALHLKAIEVATCPTRGVDLDELKRIIARRRVAACVFVPTHGNPLGHDMAAETKRDLVRLLARAGVPLVEDDAYGELTFESKRSPAAKSFDESGNVLYCSSFSKTLAPGFRVGWSVPGRHLERVKRLKFSSFVATPTCTQMAIAAFLDHGGFDRHLRSLRRTYSDLVARMIRAVGEHFPGGTRATRPAGGHVLWVELPAGVDSVALGERATRAGVGIIPGPVFSPTRRYRNFIRLNCALPWSDRVEHAVRTLGRLATEAAG